MVDKNILIVTTEFPPLPGGIGNHAYNLASQLSSLNKNITVVTNYRLKNTNEEDLFDDSNVFATKRIKRYKLTLVTYFLRFIIAFKECSKHNNRTIIASGKFSLWIIAVLSCILKKKNYIAILHGSEIRNGGNLSQKMTQWSLKQFAKIIAVSNFTKQIALQYNSNLKIEVINNGFIKPNLEFKAPSINVKGNPKIITVGNVTYRKGQQNVINALPFLLESFPNLQYHCIGIPTEKESFLKLAKSLNVQNNITFHGALPSNQLVTILDESDVFFMLSDVLKNGDFEGFGIAILEANSMGLPSIGSNNSGIVDAIKNEFSGELVNPHNVEDIVDSFKKIMNNYNDYSQNAISWSTEFNWNKIIKKYIEIIEK